MFPEFIYFGNNTNIPEPYLLPRTNSVLPMGNLNKIVDKIKSNPLPFFLFINCSETHQPFDTPNLRINKKFEKIINKMHLASASKKFFSNIDKPINNEERKILLKAQVNALEWIDKQFEILIDNLPHKIPTLYLIMADHGEEIGEFGRYGHGYPSKCVMQIPIWAKIV